MSNAELISDLLRGQGWTILKVLFDDQDRISSGLLSSPHGEALSISIQEAISGNFLQKIGTWDTSEEFLTVPSFDYSQNNLSISLPPQITEALQANNFYFSIKGRGLNISKIKVQATNIVKHLSAAAEPKKSIFPFSPSGNLAPQEPPTQPIFEDPKEEPKDYALPVTQVGVNALKAKPPSPVEKKDAPDLEDQGPPTQDLGEPKETSKSLVHPKEQPQGPPNEIVPSRTSKVAAPISPKGASEKPWIIALAIILPIILLISSLYLFSLRNKTLKTSDLPELTFGGCFRSYPGQVVDRTTNDPVDIEFCVQNRTATITFYLHDQIRDENKDILEVATVLELNDTQFSLIPERVEVWSPTVKGYVYNLVDFVCDVPAGDLIGCVLTEKNGGSESFKVQFLRT
jgi:hypothetical protein